MKCKTFKQYLKKTVYFHILIKNIILLVSMSNFDSFTNIYHILNAGTTNFKWIQKVLHVLHIPQKSWSFFNSLTNLDFKIFEIKLFYRFFDTNVLEIVKPWKILLNFNEM